MTYDARKALIRKIEALRGRKLISICNFDRLSSPRIGGLLTNLAPDHKEPLFRVLKETCKNGEGIDVFLYTRGGDTNTVWPLVCLLREFDEDFEVLVPFRAHSSGTMIALAAKKIIMTRIGELSPIDPTTGNQFNPTDPSSPTQKLGISVEDVNAYERYFHQALGHASDATEITKEIKEKYSKDLIGFLDALVKNVHPLALGNVHRVHLQIRQLATMLMCFHTGKDKIPSIVDQLTSQYYSHLHMIGRQEAKNLLETKVECASVDLEQKLDLLLRRYEDDFALRKPFFASSFLGNSRSKDVTFVGALVESGKWGYKYQTRGQLSQLSEIPSNVQLQLPHGQPMPIIQGLPRRYQLDVDFEGWVRNKKPEGVTL
jgi:hypothetical protein